MTIPAPVLFPDEQSYIGSYGETPVDEIHLPCGASFYLGNHMAAKWIATQTFPPSYENIKDTVAIVRCLPKGMEGVPIATHLPVFCVEVGDLLSETSKIQTYFSDLFEFINIHSPKGKIFFHCWKGVSRSATMLIAWIMKKYGMTCENAIEYIKQYRPCIEPNIGFHSALLKLEDTLSKSKD